LLTGFLVKTGGQMPTALERQSVVGCTLDGTAYEFEIINHAGLIDLNGADPRLLRIGFVALGLSPELATQYADKTTKFRASAQNGVASMAIGELRKGALIERISELADIVGNDKFDLGAALAVFTVSTRTMSINSELSPENLQRPLLAIGDPAVRDWALSREKSSNLTVQVIRHGNIEAKRTFSFSLFQVAMRGGVTVDEMDEQRLTPSSKPIVARSRCLDVFASWVTA